MKKQKKKELSEQTKLEMQAGRRALKMKHAVETFGAILAQRLPKDLKGWAIGDQTYIAPDEKFRVYVYVHSGDEHLQFIEEEDDFPSDELIGQLLLLLY